MKILVSLLSLRTALRKLEEEVVKLKEVLMKLRRMRTLLESLGRSS